MGGEGAQEDTVADAVGTRDLLLAEVGASLSHDLGATLRAIRGFADLLRENPALRSGEPAQHLRRIVEAAERADEVKQALSTLARLGIDRPAPSVVDLGQLVERLFAARRPRLLPADALEAQNLTPVWSDPELLERILGELLDNAITYRAEGRALIVLVVGERVGDGLRLVVRDTGRGFDPEHATQALRACQQLHPRGQYPGLGMGLTFVSHALRHLGTSLEVRTSPGAGTSMSFTLTRAPEVLADARAPESDARRETAAGTG